jgi:hypothetical protein
MATRHYSYYYFDIAVRAWDDMLAERAQDLQ